MAAPRQFVLADLLYLMERLRNPDTGCPWDLKQTYRSITSSTIEEAYEVVDAIEREDFDHLQEELGDLLFQTIFYSQLAQEDGHFDFGDIIDGLTAKLIRRHPHVFPEGTLESTALATGGSTAGGNKEEADAYVKSRWEEIKAQERQQKGKEGILEDVPTALPALTRAIKLQKRVAQVGFDWPSAAPVIAKIREEACELEQAIAEADEDSITEELGDLLFSTANLARHLKRDPERTLRLANLKFTKRFEYIEQALLRRGVPLERADPEVMEQLWMEAKRRGVGSSDMEE